MIARHNLSEVSSVQSDADLCSQIPEFIPVRPFKMARKYRFFKQTVVARNDKTSAVKIQTTDLWIKNPITA